MRGTLTQPSFVTVFPLIAAGITRLDESVFSSTSILYIHALLLSSETYALYVNALPVTVSVSVTAVFHPSICFLLTSDASASALNAKADIPPMISAATAGIIFLIVFII